MLNYVKYYVQRFAVGKTDILKKHKQWARWHSARVHVSCVEGLRFKSDSRPGLNARSLLNQQQMGQCGNFKNCAPKLTFLKFICAYNLESLRT